MKPISLSGHAQLQTDEGAARFARAIDIAAALGMEIVNTYTGDATTDQKPAAKSSSTTDSGRASPIRGPGISGLSTTRRSVVVSVTPPGIS